ncbi:MAG: B3/4 domain-containing protein [Muribaculaceae bacterium]
MEFVISDRIRAAAPAYRAIVVTADVVNRPTDDALWAHLHRVADDVRANYAMEQVNKREAIAATRCAYKACGKEPNRYRPSSEALMRRMVKGLELYRTLSVIDLINVLSVETGHSIGGFDADKIVGTTLTLGVGDEGEPYEAIGRGQLNIAGMPVWRDSLGGIGTPTSDNDRTKLSEDSVHLLMIINMYGMENAADVVVARAEELLRTYADAENIVTTLIS